jgi:hypothetical protein
MGTVVSFPRGKARPGRDADHSPPSSVRGQEGAIPPPPPTPPWRVAGQLTLLLKYASIVRFFIK